MTATLRPITSDDHDFVLDLNHRHVELLAPLGRERLEELLALTDRADVIEDDGEPAGFVLTFSGGAVYDSDNFTWFRERYGEGFYYLDRVVLDDRFRRRGLGAAAYDEIERTAAPYGRMALEVNVDPPNEPSLAFHRGRGYVDVGERGEPGHQVAMLLKDLVTHP